MAQRDLAVRLGLDSREFTQGMNAIVKNTRDTERGIRSIGDSITNLKRLAVAGFAGWGIQRIGREFLQAGIEVDRMTRAMTAITGSAKLAQGELEFLRKESNRLGLVFQDQLQSYILMSSAMKNTTLEGKGMRTMFSDIGEAATALQLPAERVKLIFYALQQMMNKGVVTMEELKRQMGDSLPGAFRIAAETAGVSLAAFTKLVEQGKVISEDFLPKFSKKIAEELGSGWKIGAESARMEMNKLMNTWFDVRKRIMEGGITDEFASTIRSINKAMAGWIDANEELIKQDVAHYIDEIKNILDRLNSVAENLGPDIVGAAGKGLVGKLLFGGAWGWWTAAFLGIEKIADLLDKMAEKSIDVKKQFDAISNLQRGGKNWLNLDFDIEDFSDESIIKAIKGMIDNIGLENFLLGPLSLLLKNEESLKTMKGIIEESLTFDITKGFFDASEDAKMLNDELLEMEDLTNKAAKGVNTLAGNSEAAAKALKELNKALKENKKDLIDIPHKSQADAMEQWLNNLEKAEEKVRAFAKGFVEEVRDTTEFDEMQEEMVKKWQHTIERIQDFTADTLYDLFQGEIEDWQDMVDRMKDIFLKGLAEIIAKAATQNIIVPILAQVVGAFSPSAGNAILNAAGSANSGVGLFNSGSSAVSAGKYAYQGYNWLTAGGPANALNASTPAYGAASGSAASGDVAAGSGLGGASMAPYATVAAIAVSMILAMIAGNEEPTSVGFFPGQTGWNEGALDYTSPYPYYRGQYEANNRTGFAAYGPTDPNEQITWYQGGESGGGPGQVYQRWDLNQNHIQEGGSAQRTATDTINQMMADTEAYYGDFLSGLSNEAFEAFTASLDDIDVDWSLGWVKPETGEGWNGFFSAKLSEIQEAIMPAVIDGLIGWAEDIDLSMFGAKPNTVLDKYKADLANLGGMSGEEVLANADNIAALINQINALENAANDANKYLGDVNAAIEGVINPLSEMDKVLRDSSAQFDNWIKSLTDIGFTEEVIAEVEAKRTDYLNAQTAAIIKQNAAIEKQLALSYVSGMKELTGGMGVPDSWWSAIGDAIKLGIDPMNINSDAIHQFVNAIIRGEVSFGDLKDVAKLLDMSLGDLLSTVNSLNNSLTEIELGAYDPRMTAGVDSFDYQKRGGAPDGSTQTGNPATSLWDMLNSVNYYASAGDARGTGETEQLLDDLVSAFNDSMQTVIETWNDFNDAMNSSSLAPVQSMEYFQKTFDELAARASGGDVAAFGDLTDFVANDFAPWMQDFGGDYSQWWTGMMGDVGEVSSGLQEGIATDSGLSPGLVSAIIAAIESGGNRPIVIEIDGKEILYATMQQIEDGDPYALSVLQGVMN